ncbi:CRISPR-associated protein Cas4 [Candidatus Cetobacterium colombiensis]|uniref:CRISPR-associated exonuclease Cas4 n=1 Tax=Candidatus Cetobacterium colombiensis TaxID=3073100 RepID=A0ABU4WCR9_9FUSO|nr:CRISPR-associated protein Cas4 [Candidatus Cetobacterium colombiensis]MDX8337024.1 CRISPR-associated protein Cas4 [Candidatus Cetobacterium colombiensis]
MLTVTDLKNYIYCPRIIYFKNLHKFSEPLKNNSLVQEGSDLHKKRFKYKNYLKKIFKEFEFNKKEVKIYDKNMDICGVVDEIFFSSKEAVPVEYKFSNYTGEIYETNLIQLTLYALLIKKTYNINVLRGYIIYTRNEVKCIEVIFEDMDFVNCLDNIKKLRENFLQEYIPELNENIEKCNSCYFKKICIL